MNISDVKEKLKMSWIKLLICILFVVFMMKNNDNTVFSNVIAGMYLYSIATLYILLFRKTESVAKTIFIFFVAIIALIILPLPGFIVNVLMILLLFSGIGYDCYWLVRLFEIKIDEKQGKKYKWEELNKLAGKTAKKKKYTDEEYRYSVEVSVSRGLAEQGKELANKMNENIIASDIYWNEIYNEKFDSNILNLRNEYDAAIADSIEIRNYFSTLCCVPLDSVLMNERYEEMRNAYNRFQRVRRNLDWVYRSIKDKSNKNNNSDAAEYFVDCDTLEKVQRRYKDLCKVYHPDMENGSSEVFVKIQKEYEELKKKLK